MEAAKVPDGSVVLHIGPPKTATTHVQAALFAARPELLRHGVRHAGGSRHPASAIQAVLGRRSAFAGGKVPPISRWNALAREVRNAGESRVIVSSEFLADARPDVVRRIVADLAPRTVHVAVTLRPLARVLPSQWQQLVCDGRDVAFDEWLTSLLEPRPGEAASKVWRRHRHHRLVERWAEVVGSERVTVIALDGDDPAAVLSHVSTLLGLEPGVLRPQDGLGNRSLTLPEAEAVRAFNTAFTGSGLPASELPRIMHFGASRYLKAIPPDPAAARVTLPAWAVEPVAAASREIVAGIRASGVRVVGDLDALGVVPPPAGAPGPGPTSGGPAVAGALAMGVMIATGLVRPGTADEPALDNVPTYAIGGVLARRAVRAVTGRVRRGPRRGPSQSGA